MRTLSLSVSTKLLHNSQVGRERHALGVSLVDNGNVLYQPARLRDTLVDNVQQGQLRLWISSKLVSISLAFRTHAYSGQPVQMPVRTKTNLSSFVLVG